MTELLHQVDTLHCRDAANPPGDPPFDSAAAANDPRPVAIAATIKGREPAATVT